MPRAAHRVDCVAGCQERADEFSFSGHKPSIHIVAVGEGSRGVIHQHGDGTELSGGEGKEVAYLCFLPYIGVTENCAAAERFNKAHGLFATGNINVGHNDRSTFMGEAESYGSAASSAT
jgi:hypothetical protein